MFFFLFSFVFLFVFVFNFSVILYGYTIPDYFCASSLNTSCCCFQTVMQFEDSVTNLGLSDDKYRLYALCANGGLYCTPLLQLR